MILKGNYEVSLQYNHGYYIAIYDLDKKTSKIIQIPKPQKKPGYITIPTLKELRRQLVQKLFWYTYARSLKINYFLFGHPMKKRTLLHRLAFI